MQDQFLTVAFSGPQGPTFTNYSDILASWHVSIIWRPSHATGKESLYGALTVATKIRACSLLYTATLLTSV